MAFLIDRGIAAESEEEFDAEGDRYEELKNKLLGGKTMKYEEMEELLAAAKARNDQRVIGALKNVVDDPPTDGVGPLAEDDGFVFNPDDPKADDLFVKADRYEEMMDVAMTDAALREIEKACGGTGNCIARDKGRYIEIHADPYKDDGRHTDKIRNVLAKYPRFKGWKVELMGSDGYIAKPADLNEAADGAGLVTSNVGKIILDFQATCEPGSELDAAAEKIKAALPPAV